LFDRSRSRKAGGLAAGPGAGAKTPCSFDDPVPDGPAAEPLGSLLRGGRSGLPRAAQARFMAADAGAVALPANPTLARVLASHIVRDGEIVLLVLRPSFWFILLSAWRFITAAIALMLFARWHGAAEHGGMIRSLIELGVSAISARLMWATLQWMSRLYVLTDMRILSLSGVFHAEIFDCPLRKVARTRLTRTKTEMVSGLGSIEIVPQDESLPFGSWQMIAHPAAVHEKVVATINRARQGGGCE
jgi:hypothetical protein